ncbi:MAG: RnfABCDGE type electron transport complex subunit A [Gammaproteobacteria bacterium]|jgi:electron transport complex protein RnfA|nr:RnfABCDGE type electron transport complex subunit A [Gammaproteobacteria bacterium]
MGNESLGFIFLNALLINNFVLAMFLGICPFLGVSAKKDTALNMGIATTFVMFVSSMCAYGLNWLLVKLGIEFLRLISYIVVIASAVQLVEMIIKKYSPALFRALGIYLPLITTNCAVLGIAVFQTAKNYDLLQSAVYSVSAGLGFTLALLLMAGLREKLVLADVPSIARGTGMTLILAGLLSLAFMGFAGLGGGGD